MIYFYKKDFEDILSSNLIDWNLFKNKIILITGGTGMLGSYIIKTFMYLNDNIFKNNKVKIVSIIRNLEYAKLLFSKDLKREDFVIINKDICDVEDIEININIIIHAASISRPDNNNPVGVIKPNSIGTFNMLNLSRKLNLECFIYISSGEIYGYLDKDIINETDIGLLDHTSIRSCYGESKRFSENLCISFNKQYNIPVKIIRLFHTYGPSMNLEKDVRVFSKFTKNILNNKSIEIYNNSSDVKRCFCYITDFILGLLVVIQKGENEIYNLANPKENISIIDFAKKLIKISNSNVSIKYLECKDISYLVSKIVNAVPSINKLKKLGWEPKINIEKGFLNIFKCKMI